jgi:SAM-dependent methyltransferase
VKTDAKLHWEDVYASRSAEQVSWYRAHLEVSFELLLKGGLNAHSRVIDVGGGASTLVDDLLDFGVRAVAVVDLSAASLSVARQRLGEQARRVSWIVADMTRLDVAESSFDLWHDRAALHFLVDPLAAAAYVRAATDAIAPGGCAVIGCFAADGPKRCSSLPVVGRDPEDIAALFGAGFSLIESRRELHRTPSGHTQPFAYTLLRKAP